MDKCPKCGETELFQFTYDYSKAHRPVINILCNNCGEQFPPISKLPKQKVMKNIHLLPTSEIWKDVIGYEEFYQVSNFGNVKSLGNEYTRKERLLKLSTQSKGYLTVVLQKNATRKMILVHRLVAEHFIYNTESKQQVNHINGNKTDNRVENLEWVSHRENLDHAIKNNLTLKGEENRNSKLKDIDVVQIHSLLQKGVTTKELSESYNVSYSTIDGIRTNRYWKHLNLPKI